MKVNTADQTYLDFVSSFCIGLFDTWSAIYISVCGKGKKKAAEDTQMTIQNGNCSSVIISDRFILTSAACVAEGTLEWV